MKYFDVVATTYYKGRNVFDLEDEEVQPYVDRTINEVIKPVFGESIVEYGICSVIDDFTQIGADSVGVDWTICVKAETDDEVYNAIDEANTDANRASFIHEVFDVTNDAEAEEALKVADVIYVPQIEDCIREAGVVRTVNVWDDFGHYTERRQAVAECYNLAYCAMNHAHYSIPEGHFHAVSIVAYVMRDGERVVDDVIEIIDDVEHEGSENND